MRLCLDSLLADLSKCKQIWKEKIDMLISEFLKKIRCCVAYKQEK